MKLFIYKNTSLTRVIAKQVYNCKVRALCPALLLPDYPGIPEIWTDVSLCNFFTTDIKNWKQKPQLTSS